jgi:CheY-like chemotaxis protein
METKEVKRPRILVVDDEPSVRHLNSEMLGKHYSVDTAVDGSDGFYKAISGNYDLYIFDIIMPKVNGIDMLKYIRQETSRNTPCVFITGGTPSLDLPKEIDSLVSNYGDHVVVLQKPYNVDSLLQQVNDMLAGIKPASYFPGQQTHQ